MEMMFMMILVFIIVTCGLTIYLIQSFPQLDKLAYEMNEFAKKQGIKEDFYPFHDGFEVKGIEYIMQYDK